MVSPTGASRRRATSCVHLFGLLAGGEIYGLAGILIALPLLAAGRAVYEFFSERVALEPWTGAGPVPVEVEVEAPPPPAPVVPAPEPEPAAEKPRLRARRTKPRA